MLLSQAARIGGGELQGGDAPFAGMAIDSRVLEAGQLFVALKGEHSDGHAHLADAAVRGAAGAVVERFVKEALPQIQVSSSQDALQQIAHRWRQRFDIPVIAVTGSNGKTTVKEMLGAILRQSTSDAEVLVTRGNLNNHLGVPLTLSRLEQGHRYAVIEMGASAQTEIARLAELAAPTVGLVTNAGVAHLEGFGSRDGIARGKGELFAGLPENGTAIINNDDDYEELWGELAGDRQVLRFGLESGADVTARALEFDGDRTRFRLITPRGEAAVELALVGRHNVANALAAAAAACAVGLEAGEIALGLSHAVAVDGRLKITRAINDARLVDDSYNANPGSLQAALDSVRPASGEYWLALGDMAELGDDAESAHRQAGEAARAAGVQRLFTLGRLSRLAAEGFGEGAAHYDDHQGLIDALSRTIAPGVTLLVKGSRSARMDRVAKALLAADERSVGAGVN